MPASGSCLCGAVRFNVDGPLRPVINCHCGQCRKWTGHFVAATAAWKEDINIEDPEAMLSWYRSSVNAARGFCGRCGSSMFWQVEGEDRTSILAGTLKGESGLNTAAQIYVEDKGDYYSLDNPSVPCFQQSGHDVHLPPREETK